MTSAAEHAQEIRRLQANHLLGAAEEPAQQIVVHLDAILEENRRLWEALNQVTRAALRSTG